MQSSASESEEQMVAQQKIEELRELRLRQRFEGFSLESLLWLALPAAWTRELAEACGFPPGPLGKLEEFFRVAIERGLVTVNRQRKRVGKAVETTELLLVSDIDQAQIIDYFLSSHPFTYNPAEQNISNTIQQMFVSEKGSPNDLRSVFAEVGWRISEAGRKVNGVPPLLLLWAELAALAGDSRKAAAAFDARTEEAFRQRNAGRIQDWVTAARPLVTLIEKDTRDPYVTILTRSIRLAQRRMELLHRRNIDSTHLDDYFRRLEQVRAFNELMDGPDDLWALHYLGAGGAGKTMFMRDLTLYLTGEQDPLKVGSSYPETIREVRARPDVVVARVDFDYLNADYPRIDPGQLLNELAEELQAYDSGERAVEKFRDAKSRFNEVRERVDNEFLSMGGRATELREFFEGMQFYIDGLKILGRRVLLILDTCEELAKASDQGSATIDETFRILNALHDGFPSLRVVLSGRRALASAGHWVEDRFSWRLSPCILPERPFLRLHEMRGFEFEEVAFFLKYEEIEERYIQAIWRASCPDIHVVYKIDWQGEQAQVQPAAIQRCNPYKMSQFKDWVRDSTPPNPEEIALATPTTYVKARIIDRLSKEHIDYALLAAAVLGHFNRSTLAVACNSDQEAIGQAFDRLSEQEWVAHTFEPDAEEADRLMLHAERGVRDGLLAYYNQNQGAQVIEVRRRAGRILREKIKNTPLDQLSWPLIDAALACSQAEPEEAAAWWRSLEMRLFLARDSRWVLDTIDHVLGKDGSVFLREVGLPPETPPENALRPLVLATQAAALLQLGDTRDLPKVWQEVAQKSAGVAYTQTIWLRACAGEVAVAGYTRAPIDAEMATKFWDQVIMGWNNKIDPELAAGWIAALEALVEEAERKKGEGGLALAETLMNSSRSDSSAPDAFWLAERVDERLSRSEDGDMQDLCAFTWMLAARAALVLGNTVNARQAFERSLALSPQRRRTPVRRWLDWSPPRELRTRLRLELARMGSPAVFSPLEALDILQPWTNEIDSSAQPNTDMDRFWTLVLNLNLALGTNAGGIPPSQIDPASGLFAERSLSGNGATLPNAYRLVPPLFVAEADALASQGKVEEALSRLKQVSLQSQAYETRDIQHAERGLLRLICRYRLAEEGETSGAQLAASPQPADRALVEHPFAQRPRISREIMARRSSPDNESRVPLGEDGPTDPEWALRSALRRLGESADMLTRIHSPLPSAVGGRRAGEVALEEADLLIVSAPGQAVRVYAQAAEWLEASGSLPETLIARIGVGLSQLAAAKGQISPGEFVDTLASIESSYRLVQEKSGVSLPPYEELQNLAFEPDRAGLEALRPAGWRPWLVRLVYLLSRTMATSSSVDLRGWGAWLSGHDAPLEMVNLDDWLEITGSVKEGKAATPETSPGERPWWLSAIYYVLGGGGGVFGVFIVFELIRSSFTWLTPLAATPQTTWLKGLNVSVGSLISLVVIALASGAVTLLEDSTKKKAKSNKEGQTEGSCLFTGLYLGLGIVGVLGILGIVGGVAWAVYIALETSAVMGSISPFVRWSIAIATVLSAIGILYRLFTLPGWVRSFLASKSFLIGSAVPSEPNWRDEPSVQGRDAQGLRWLWTEIGLKLALFRNPLLRQVRTPFAYYVPLEAARSNAAYSRFAGLSSEAFIQELKNLRQTLKNRTMQVVLDPPEGGHEPCWEAGLVYPLMDSKLGDDYLRQVPFRFIRQTSANVSHLSTGDVGEVDTPDFRSWRIANPGETLPIFSWLSAGDAFTQQQVSSAWKKLRRGDWHLIENGIFEEANCIVHLVGKVDSRRGTISLRIDPDSRMDKSAGASFVTAIDVRRSFPRAALCVVQGTPQVEGSERLDSDRREAGLGRVLCSELVTQGVPVAIYLPMMEQSLAQSVLEALAGACKPGARLEQIQAGLRKAQQLIVKRGAGSGDAWECALDVCLYVSSGEQDGKEALQESMLKMAA